MHTTHTGGSGFRRKCYVAHEQGDDKAMQQEIDDLKKQLRRAQQKQSPSSSNVSSKDEEDIIYRQRSKTPPSESFSCEVGTDVMKKALSQFLSHPLHGG